MKRIEVLLVAIFCISINYNVNAQEKKSYDLSTIAFYNLENLFDTLVDPDPNKILQDEFTPKGKNKWTTDKYLNKLDHMSSVIAELGSGLSKTAPMIVGIAEVENKAVIEDLIHTKYLEKYNYGIVHYESNDGRGIDVGLIYRKDFVKIKNSNSSRLHMAEKPDFRTRDQLVVEAEIDGESIFVLVNHWPSRRGGEKRSSPLREAAAQLTRTIADSITHVHPNAKIIIMGDLNDDPNNKSVKKVINTSGDKKEMKEGQYFNTMEKNFKSGNGTLAYNDTWNLFDQLIISPALLHAGASEWKFYKAEIFKDKELIQTEGAYKGYPKRTFAGGVWLGGYSDHFPVYLYLIKEKK